jgi:peptidyl-prolyl cis-trans isomerase B (cyclophilin B)
MDVVEAIAAVQTGNAGGHQDVPVEDIVVEKVTITDQEG